MKIPSRLHRGNLWQWALAILMCSYIALLILLMMLVPIGHAG